MKWPNNGNIIKPMYNCCIIKEADKEQDIIQQNILANDYSLELS